MKAEVKVKVEVETEAEVVLQLLQDQVMQTLLINLESQFLGRLRDLAVTII